MKEFNQGPHKATQANLTFLEYLKSLTPNIKLLKAYQDFQFLIIDKQLAKLMVELKRI